MYKALEQKISDEKNVTLKVSLTSVAKKTLITFQLQFIRVIRSMPETVFMRVAAALFRPVTCVQVSGSRSKFRIPNPQNQIPRDIPAGPAKMDD
jgi:hypothetical protein